MDHIPLQDFGRADKAGLYQFLCYCQEKARKVDHAILGTISLASEYLDPLAVLQTVNDPSKEHCYLEHYSRHEGVACAEPVLHFEGSGTDRFDKLRDYAKQWLEYSVFVGDQTLPWAGPHFFIESTFEDTLEDIDFIPPVLAFVPRWQVGWKGNQFSATANIVVDKDMDLDLLIESVWRAHKHFSAFEFEGETQENSIKAVAKNTRLLDKSASESKYLKAVQSALHEIRSGNIEKVVLSRELKLESEQPFEPLEILDILRTRYPDCFTFSFQNNKGASIIGATPERLIRVEKGKFETEALAGSIGRGQNARQDAHLTKQLLSSSKDRSEHGLVLKFIKDELERIGLNAEFAAIPEVLQLSNIQHLKVPLHGSVPDGMHVLDLVKTLHPTPALGGYPAEPAKALIKKLEGHQRGSYAGLTGWFNASGEGEMVVNIRCAKVDGHKATFYAGAGIVKESIPENELQETELKLTGMLPIFINMDVI